MRLLHAIAVIAFMLAQCSGAAQAFAGVMPCQHGQQQQQHKMTAQMDCAKMHQQHQQQGADCCKHQKTPVKCPCCGDGISVAAAILAGVALPLPLPAAAPELRGTAHLVTAFAPPALRPPISLS